MPVERIYPHPAMRENVGCVALRSGPLLYCLETSDNPLPLYQTCIPANASFEKQFVADLLGGVVLLTSKVRMLDDADWGDELYRTKSPVLKPYSLTAIPYYAWDHREAGEMRVWLRTCGDEKKEDKEV
jgi:DUF1680 family protein